MRRSSQVAVERGEEGGSAGMERAPASVVLQLRPGSAFCAPLRKPGLLTAELRAVGPLAGLGGPRTSAAHQPCS